MDGKKLICLVGGEGSVAVAFDKDTGKELWQALSAEETGYCPPTMIEAGGKRQLLIWHAEAINSLDPETGKVYWSVPLEPNYGMAIMAPRQSGDYLFAGGIGCKAVLLKLAADKPAAEEVWRGQDGHGRLPGQQHAVPRGRHHLRRRSSPARCAASSWRRASGCGRRSRRRPAAGGPAPARRSWSRTATASSCSARRAT